jgi:hypothetical protein
MRREALKDPGRLWPQTAAPGFLFPWLGFRFWVGEWYKRATWLR